VPVGQRDNAGAARGLPSRLRLSQQAGAGHWWDVSPEPGADCVDWPPLFDFFARHLRPDDESVWEVEFATASPGVSRGCTGLAFWRRYTACKLAPYACAGIGPAPLCRYDGERRPPGPGAGHHRSRRAVTVELDGQKLEIPWPAKGDSLLTTTEPAGESRESLRRC